MAKLWAAFHGAREVLALGAVAALLAVLAEPGAAAGPASMALLAVLAEAGAATRPAILALLAVLAEAGAAASPATLASLAVRALLPNVAPDWVRRRGGGAAGTAGAACAMARNGSDYLLQIWLGCL